MQKPEMILFDYAHTLAWEPDADFLRGEKTVFAHVKDNPRQVTPEEAARLGTELFLAARDCRHSGWELHEHQQLRLKYDLLGLTFDLPMAELEKRLWTAACPGEPMPGVQAMLAELRARGIRTGVISNLGWSGEALEDRLHRLLPEHRFEFVIASSDYGVRKPNPLIFRAALSRAGLSPEAVWFCGDQIEADVFGAQAAGIFPVWYEDAAIPNGFARKNAGLTITGEHLHIHHWRELIAALDEGFPMSTKETIVSRLRALHIPHEYHEHAPAYTMADCLALPYAAPDMTFCKNLLLCNTPKTAFYLYVTLPDKPFRTGDVSKRLGSSRLSFAPAECLPEMLHLEPGSLSPLGLWFDGEHRIKLAFDRDVQRSGRIAFHPCDNTATVVFEQQVFWEQTVPALGHEAIFI